jgi:hypothetical protein
MIDHTVLLIKIAETQLTQIAHSQDMNQQAI